MSGNLARLLRCLQELKEELQAQGCEVKIEVGISLDHVNLKSKKGTHLYLLPSEFEQLRLIEEDSSRK